MQQFKRDFDILEEQLIIGSIASFREAKNHAFMIEIAKEMKRRKIDFVLFLAGSGALYDEIKQEVISNALEKQVVFLGIREDVPVLMKSFDVLLMPPLYEGLPVTLVESQASNLAAVVSTNVTDEVDFNLGMILKVSLDDTMEDFYTSSGSGHANVRKNGHQK